MKNKKIYLTKFIEDGAIQFALECQLNSNVEGTTSETIIDEDNPFRNARFNIGGISVSFGKRLYNAETGIGYKLSDAVLNTEAVDALSKILNLIQRESDEPRRITFGFNRDHKAQMRIQTGKAQEGAGVISDQHKLFIPLEGHEIHWFFALMQS